MDYSFRPLASEKVLTLAEVTEIIAVTKPLPGQESANEAIVERIDARCAAGYKLSPEAKHAVDKYRR